MVTLVAVASQISPTVCGQSIVTFHGFRVAPDWFVKEASTWNPDPQSFVIFQVRTTVPAA